MLTTPIANQILDNLVETLKKTGKDVGTEYHHGGRLVTRAPGVSPKWFENSEWDTAYWVIAPEERNKEMTAFQFDATLEVFIVGAKAGKWSLLPEKQKPPTREQVQQEVAYDIKKAVLVDFRRGCTAYNSNLTNVKFAFTAWPNFAIVSSRWEFKYIWRRDQP